MVQLKVFLIVALIALANIPSKCEAKCLIKSRNVAFAGFKCKLECVTKRGEPKDKNIVTCVKTDLEYGIPTGLIIFI